MSATAPPPPASMISTAQTTASSSSPPPPVYSPPKITVADLQKAETASCAGAAAKLSNTEDRLKKALQDLQYARDREQAIQRREHRMSLREANDHELQFKNELFEDYGYLSGFSILACFCIGLVSCIIVGSKDPYDCGDAIGTQARVVFACCMALLFAHGIEFKLRVEMMEHTRRHERWRAVLCFIVEASRPAWLLFPAMWFMILDQCALRRHQDAAAVTTA